MAERRITITKRVSLAGLAEDWDDCYAVVTPASYEDFQQLGQLEPGKMTNAQQNQTVMDLAATHLVAGKVKTFGSDELSDIKAEDVRGSLDLATRLYLEILGLKLDPKDLNPAPQNDGTPQNSAGTTGTTSSTGSPPESPSASSETSSSSATASTSDSRTSKP